MLAAITQCSLEKASDSFVPTFVSFAVDLGYLEGSARTQDVVWV